MAAVMLECSACKTRWFATLDDDEPRCPNCWKLAEDEDRT